MWFYNLIIKTMADITCLLPRLFVRYFLFWPFLCFVNFFNFVYGFFTGLVFRAAKVKYFLFGLVFLFIWKNGTHETVSLFLEQRTYEIVDNKIIVFFCVMSHLTLDIDSSLIFYVLFYNALDLWGCPSRSILGPHVVEVNYFVKMCITCRWMLLICYLGEKSYFLLFCSSQIWLLLVEDTCGFYPKKLSNAQQLVYGWHIHVP
jgi:hypothetical protein